MCDSTSGTVFGGIGEAVGAAGSVVSGTATVAGNLVIPAACVGGTLLAAGLAVEFIAAYAVPIISGLVFTLVAVPTVVKVLHKRYAQPVWGPGALRNKASAPVRVQTATVVQGDPRLAIEGRPAAIEAPAQHIHFHGLSAGELAALITALSGVPAPDAPHVLTR